MMSASASQPKSSTIENLEAIEDFYRTLIKLAHENHQDKPLPALKSAPGNYKNYLRYALSKNKKALKNQWNNGHQKNLIRQLEALQKSIGDQYHDIFTPIIKNLKQINDSKEFDGWVTLQELMITENIESYELMNTLNSIEQKFQEKDNTSNAQHVPVFNELRVGRTPNEFDTQTIYPEDVEIYFRLGKYHSDRKAWLEAQKNFQLALEAFDNENNSSLSVSPIHLNLAGSLLNLGNTEDEETAIQLFDLAISTVNKVKEELYRPAKERLLVEINKSLEHESIKKQQCEDFLKELYANSRIMIDTIPDAIKFADVCIKNKRYMEACLLLNAAIYEFNTIHPKTNEDEADLMILKEKKAQCQRMNANLLYDKIKNSATIDNPDNLTSYDAAIMMLQDINIPYRTLEDEANLNQYRIEYAASLNHLATYDVRIQDYHSAIFKLHRAIVVFTGTENNLNYYQNNLANYYRHFSDVIYRFVLQQNTLSPEIAIMNLQIAINYVRFIPAKTEADQNNLLLYERELADHQAALQNRNLTIPQSSGLVSEIGFLSGNTSQNSSDPSESNRKKKRF